MTILTALSVLFVALLALYFVCCFAELTFNPFMFPSILSVIAACIVGLILANFSDWMAR